MKCILCKFRRALILPGVLLITLLSSATPLFATQYHVWAKARSGGDGGEKRPFRTITQAAQVAVAGDTITVHAGVYREWIDPPRGGESSSLPILYRAKEGDVVEIKGSEMVDVWEECSDGVWKVELPNTFFGAHNPYKTAIEGDWYVSPGWVRHTGEIFLNGKALCEQPSMERVIHPTADSSVADVASTLRVWYCESDEQTTTIWANFQGDNPNRALVEISTRPTCFYPSKPNVNYITIRGFRFSQAATQWPAPTAEQIGMVATHWNKGWVIENNVIHDSKCAGITLGKERTTGHNVWSANPTFDGSLHYLEVIFKTLRHGWNREEIGSHKIVNNTIYNCGQSGICGSMGAAFSEVVGNHIYNINTNRQLVGPEKAGIKFHGAIDVLIEGNRIHDTEKGLFLDWMTQGCRVTRNLFYNNMVEDLYMEVNHGPYIVDHNIFASPFNLWDMSDGGAFVNNLFLGKIRFQPDHTRYTPYHLAHSTEVAGVSIIRGGDNRFYNNIFMPNQLEAGAVIAGSYGLGDYVQGYPVFAAGNSYYGVAQPLPKEERAHRLSTSSSEITLEAVEDELFLNIQLDEAPLDSVSIVTTEMLGKTVLAKAPYVDPQGRPLIFDRDYLGKKALRGYVGPLSTLQQGVVRVKVW